MPTVKGFGTYRDYDWMYEHYIVQKMSMDEVSQKANCCAATVYLWLKRLGIKKRTLSEALRLEWTKGSFDHVHSSPEFRRKQSIATKASWEEGRYDGAHTSPETRQRHSVATKASWAKGVFDEGISSPEFGQKMSEIAKAAWASGKMDNARSSPEYRKKVSDSVKAAHARGVYKNPETLRKMGEGIKKAWADGKFDGVFQSPTSIERETEQTLKELNFKYIAEYRPEGYSRTYDFFLPDLGVTIECQGNYWHTRPGMEERDDEKWQWAVDHGYTPVELWESDIKEHRVKLLLVEDLVGAGIL